MDQNIFSNSDDVALNDEPGLYKPNLRVGTNHPFKARDVKFAGDAPG